MKLSIKIPLLIGIAVLRTIASIVIPMQFLMNRQIVNNYINELSIKAESGAELLELKLESKLLQLFEIANRTYTRTMDFDGVVRNYLIPDISRLGVLEIGIVYPDGTTRYVSDNSTANLGDRDYIIKAFGGNLAISDIIISRVINRPVLMLAVPILESSEPGAPVIGVLIAREDGGRALSDLVNEIEARHENTFAFMLDNESTFVAHSNQDLVFDQFNLIKEAENDPSHKSMADLSILAVRQRSGHSSYIRDGIRYRTAFAEVPGYPWIIFVSMEESIITGELSRMFMIIVAIGLACLAIGIFVAFIIGKSIARPVIRVVDTLKYVSEGDMTKTVNVNS
jgi:methyl-accepting chemotaxis protein